MADSRRCACGQLSGHRGALTDGTDSGFRWAARQRSGRSSSSPGTGGLGAQGGDAGPSGRLRRLPQQSTGGSLTFPDTLPLPWRAPDARRARSDALLLLRHRVPPNRAGQMVVVPCSGGRRAWRSRGRRGASRCERRSCSRCTKMEARRLERGGRLAHGRHRGTGTAGAGVGRRREEDGRPWRGGSGVKKQRGERKC